MSAGKTICISSVHEVIPWGGYVNDAASKGGLLLMMKTIAQEAAPSRIRVNSICPGAVSTSIDTGACVTPETYGAPMNLVPDNRFGESEDIGHVAVFPGFGADGLHRLREHFRRRRHDALPRVRNRRIAKGEPMKQSKNHIV